MLQKELANARDDEMDSKLVLQKTKDLQYLEAQERITKLASERESQICAELVREKEVTQMKIG